MSRLPSIATEVTSDSKQISNKSVFVAIRGGSRDGHQFISEAVALGAVCVVGEESLKKVSGQLGRVPYIQVPDSRLALSYLAARFVGHPSKGMTVVGVTGTSGKTTTTYILESVLRLQDFESG